MDPFTALAVAGNILQFIQFAGGLLSNTRKIYSSVDGVSDESAHLNDICERLANFHSLLHQSQGGFPECTNRPQSQHEVAISECAALCKKDCEELLTIATKLRAKTSTAKAPRCWGSFKAAMVEVWNAGEIEALKARIADRQRAMTLHICAISSENTKDTRAQLRRLEVQWDTQFSRLFASLGSIEQRVAKLRCSESATTSADLDGVCVDLRNLSLEATQEAKCFALLASLRYSDRPARHDKIPGAHKATFDWALMKPARVVTGKGSHSLRRWLRAANSSTAFWVSGKPGSGKSTFMKFVADNPRTKMLLQKWSGSQRLIVATHYFTIHGTPIQRSLEGLLRSLLYDVFKGDRTLIPKIFPDRLQERLDAITNATPWTLSQLEFGLQSVAEQRHIGTKICFFVDGLDEYNGDHLEICQTLKELSRSPSIKVCVSSRPWNVFEDALGTVPDAKIYMHELTREDIRRYIEATLHAHPRWRVLEDASGDSSGEALVGEVVAKSSGVFLWVTIVARLLREGLTNGDTIRDLKKRLSVLPSDLGPFFRHILDTVDTFYNDKMARMLLFARHAGGPMDLRMYMYHEMEHDNENYALREPAEAPQFRTEDEYNNIMDPVYRRINGRCKGLLERNGRRIEFLHRTVFDFLHTCEMREFLSERIRGQFDPSLSLLRASCMALKQSWFRDAGSPSEGADPRCGAGDFVSHVQDALQYARQSDELGGSSAISTGMLLDNVEDSLPGMLSRGQLPAATSVMAAKTRYRCEILTAGISGYIRAKMPDPTYFDWDNTPEIKSPLFYVISSRNKPFLQWAIGAFVQSGYSPNDPCIPDATGEGSSWVRCIESFTPSLDTPSWKLDREPGLAGISNALENDVFWILLNNGADPNAWVYIDRKQTSDRFPAWMYFLMLAEHIPSLPTRLAEAYEKVLNFILGRCSPGIKLPSAPPRSWAFRAREGDPAARRYLLEKIASSISTLSQRTCKQELNEVRDWIMGALSGEESAKLHKMLAAMMENRRRLMMEPLWSGKRSRMVEGDTFLEELGERGSKRASRAKRNEGQVGVSAE